MKTISFTLSSKCSSSICQDVHLFQMNIIFNLLRNRLTKDSKLKNVYVLRSGFYIQLLKNWLHFSCVIFSNFCRCTILLTLINFQFMRFKENHIRKYRQMYLNFLVLASCGKALALFVL